MLNSSLYTLNDTLPHPNHPTTLPEATPNICTMFDSTAEMMQVINAQNILIIKLLHKQNMLYQDLQQTKESSHSSEPRPSRTNTILCMPSQYDRSPQHSSDPISSE